MILLVEDEVILAMTQKAVLEKYGYKVTTVHNGEAAVKTVDTLGGIELILMDIDLGPGIDGTEAARQILQKHDIPVVFVSSHTEPEIVEKTEKITSYGYIVKNSSITVLDASIKMAFKLFKAKRQVSEKNTELVNHAQLLENIIEQFPGFVVWKDLNSAFQGCNSNFARKCGVSSPNGITGKTDADLPFTKEETASYIADDREVMQSGTPKLHIEEQGHVAGNEVVYLDTSKIPLLDAEGRVSGLLAVSTDITARKKAELALKEQNEAYETMNEKLRCATEELQTQNEELMQSEELLRQSESQFALFMDHLPAIAFLKDSKGKTLFTNKYMDTVLNSSGWKGKTMLEVFPGEFGRKLFEDDMRILQDGYKAIDESIPHVDGSMHDYETQKFIINKARNKQMIGGISLDITERKRAEKALRESETRLTQAERIAKIGNWTLRLDTGMMMASKGANEIYGLNIQASPLAEIQKIPLHEYRETLDRSLSDLVAGKAPYDLEFKICRQNDGAIADIHSVATYDRQTNTVFGLIEDITERKKADDTIKDLLAEKELRLKEVHHRIKNNMATISGLLSLQAATMQEPGAVSALNETASRVKSMALLYDRIYNCDDTSALPVRMYLPALIDDICANFPGSEKITVEKKIGDFMLDVKLLQPLGIIINELLTNIMKYAFTGRDAGVIAVSAELADDLVTVTVKDDGNGIPDSVSFEHSTGFGLLLVKGLTQQLRGTIRIERGPGTGIVLEFKK